MVVSLDAHNAMKILNTQSIDMILLDIMMPKVDGFTLCQEIKSQEKTTKYTSTIYKLKE